MYSSRRYYFSEIAETLNITKAAEHLMVSQPSLSSYLNKLEGELDIKLVDRRYTPLHLTEAGRIYRDYLIASRELDRRFFEQLDVLRSGKKSPLRIGVPLQKSHDAMQVVLPNFIAEHPEVNVHIDEGTSRTVRDNVAKGELEIGFAHTLSAEDEDCQVTLLNSERILIICHRDNPIVGGRETSPENSYKVNAQLLNEQLFFQMESRYFLYEVEAEHLKRHACFPRQKLVMSNLHSIISTILQNPLSGFAYMPDYVFAQPTAAGMVEELAFLRLDDEDIKWYFSMLRKKDKPLSREGKYFWNCVLDTCGEYIPGM